MTQLEVILIGLLSVAHTPKQAEHAARTVLRDHPGHTLDEAALDLARRINGSAS